MENHVYLAFVVATTVMIALPGGPSVVLTVTHRISFGWQPAQSTVAGATMGIAVQLIVAAIGLTSLLIVAGAFEWLRWAGAGRALGRRGNRTGPKNRTGIAGRTI